MKIRMKTLRKLIKESIDELEPLDVSERNLDYDIPAEGKHAKGHLFHTAEDAKRLHDLLRESDNIPTWCLEYLAISRHGIGMVHDYLSYKINSK